MFCPKTRRVKLRTWLRMSAAQKSLYMVCRKNKEIKACQETPKVVFSRAACKRLVKELIEKMEVTHMYVAEEAYDAIAQAVQQVGTTFFEDCAEVAWLTGHKTIMPKHTAQVRRQWVKQDARVEATR
jgi:histone H3/H4